MHFAETIFAFALLITIWSIYDPIFYDWWLGGKRLFRLNEFQIYF